MLRFPSPLAGRALGAAALGLSTLVLGCGPGPVDLQRPETTAALTAFESCEELEATLKKNLREEMETQLLLAEQQELTWQFGYPVPLASDMGNEAGGTRTEGQDFSGTNNQELGVDEADFVKTDGWFLYVLNGQRLEIMAVPEFGQLEHTSTVELEGWPSQMLLDGDRVSVFSNVYAWDLPDDHPLKPWVNEETEDWGWYWRGQTLTKVTVVQLDENRSSPIVVRELYLEGWLMTGREADGTVRMITYGEMDLPGLRWWPQTDEGYWALPWGDPRRAAALRQATVESIAHNNAVIDGYTVDNFVPRLYERTRLGNVDDIDLIPFESGGCQNFSIAEDGRSHGVTSVLTFDLRGEELQFEADHIVTNWSTLYASRDVLLVVEPAWDWWWYWGMDDTEEKTNVHRFDISTAGVTAYTGSGRVFGTVLGPFALDEHEGTVRVATTRGRWNRWWEANQDLSENWLYTLEGTDKLVQVGEVGPLAKGERIWASRFTDDTAYLVTFRNIDPLFTIDVRDAHAPRLIGELEVPGVSTYIHPLDGARLLTIGYRGDDEGLDWGATQLSLFDVADLAAPVRSDTLALAPTSGGPSDGWVWSYSEALYEHKAFQYWGPLRMLAVPLSTWREWYTGNDWRYQFVSRLELVSVGDDQLTRYGTIDHSAYFNDNDDDWWWSNRDIRRTLFMGDYVYAVSDRVVTVHAVDGLVPMAHVELPGSAGEPWGW